MKTKALLLVIALGLLTASCGVKSDLTRPDGTPTPKDTRDPSKPPYPMPFSCIQLFSAFTWVIFD